jgi:hypothetical protein
MHLDAWHPVAYLSPSLNASEQNYPIPEQEQLALMYSLKKWRHVPFALESTAYIDNLSLSCFERRTNFLGSPFLSSKPLRYFPRRPMERSSLGVFSRNCLQLWTTKYYRWCFIDRTGPWVIWCYFFQVATTTRDMYPSSFLLLQQMNQLLVPWSAVTFATRTSPTIKDQKLWSNSFLFLSILGCWFRWTSLHFWEKVWIQLPTSGGVLCDHFILIKTTVDAVETPKLLTFSASIDFPGNPQWQRAQVDLKILEEPVQFSQGTALIQYLFPPWDWWTKWTTE